MTETDPNRIYIREMADRLDRAEHTIRQWLAEKRREPEKDGAIPDELLPDRGPRGVIFWRPDQVDGLVVYARTRAARRGWQPSES
jgi:hypothetical protein